jgi:hypothetical protein
VAPAGRFDFGPSDARSAPTILSDSVRIENYPPPRLQFVVRVGSDRERVADAVPFGHGKTTTFVAAFRLDGLFVPW